MLSSAVCTLGAWIICQSPWTLQAICHNLPLPTLAFACYGNSHNCRAPSVPEDAAVLPRSPASAPLHLQHFEPSHVWTSLWRVLTWNMQEIGQVSLLSSKCHQCLCQRTDMNTRGFFCFTVNWNNDKWKWSLCIKCLCSEYVFHVILLHKYSYKVRGSSSVIVPKD